MKNTFLLIAILPDSMVGVDALIVVVR